MSCCNSGLAIIKFSLYVRGQFKYKLSAGSAWKTIDSLEPLTWECKEIVGYEPGQRIVFYYKTERDGIVDPTIHFLGYFADWQEPVSYTIGDPYSVGSSIEVTGRNLAGEESSNYSLHSYTRIIPLGWGAHPLLEPIIKVDFTVKGAETGAEYLSLTDLDQCPEVQQEGCQLQPEQNFKIEVPFKVIPNPFYAGSLFKPWLTLNGCLYTDVDEANSKVNVWVKYQYNGVTVDPLNLFGWNKIITSIPYDPNCPPPPVTITCSDDKAQECPPETDCEITCKGFKCCYSKGKVIKVIPVN